MSKRTLPAALAALVSLFALTVAAAPPVKLPQPVLLATPVDLPQVPECDGILTPSLLDRANAATEDPADTFEKWRRVRHTMMEAPPWVECESKMWRALKRRSGLFATAPQSSGGTFNLKSNDPVGQAFLQSLTASVGTNIDPDGGVPSYQGEMQIAVNPNNHLQLVAGANTFYRDPSANCLSPTGGFSGTDGTQALYGSNDGGATWSYRCAPWPVSLTGPAGGSFFFGSDPAVAWDSQGRAYAAYMLLADGSGLGTAIVVARSTDAGQTWTSLGTVVNDLANPSLFDDKEMMAIDNSAGPPSAKSHPGRIYVVWDQNNIERVAHSDDGVTWTTVVLPSTGFGDFDIGSDVKVGADGTVYVIWNRLIYPSNQTGEKIVFSKSVDGGTTWSAPVAVASTALLSFGTNNTPPAQDYRGVNAFGSLDLDRNPASAYFGTLYITFADFPSGTSSGTDLNTYVVRSTDGGATWSPRVKVNDDAGTATQFFPWLSVDQSDGTVNVSWYDTRLDPATNRKTQVFYGRSVDGGLSFEPNLLVTDNGAVGWRNAVNYSDEGYYENYTSNANQYGDYGGCVASNRQVHPFWVDSRQFWPAADTNSPSRVEDAGTATIVNCSAPAAIAAPSTANSCAAPRVTISWSATSGWGTNATNGTYSVYRSVTSTFTGGTPLVSGLTTTTFDDTTGLPGNTYYYFVAAKNNCPGTPLTPMTTVSPASGAVVFPPCGATLGTLKGTVTSNGIPVVGASVTAGVYNALTDANGQYSFIIVTGTYSVNVTMAGYNAASQSGVVITDGITTTVNFTLTPTATTACFTDTTQADFQAGSAQTNVDLTTTPGSVKLASAGGGTFQTSGSFVSSLKDSGAVVVGGAMTWTTLTWTSTTPANTTIRFQVAASSSASGPFIFVGPDGTAATYFTTSGASLAQFNGRRYLKYMAFLSTTDATVTPSLDSVVVCDQVAACSGPAAPTVTPAAPQVCPFSTGNTASGPAGALAYEWAITNGTITAGANAQSVTYTAGPSGSVGLTLIAYNATGCSASSTVSVTIDTTTTTPTITPGGPTTFCSGGSVTLGSSAAAGNQWYLNGVAINGATSQQYIAAAAGSYTVAATAGGCSSFPSTPVTVTVTPLPATPSIGVTGTTTFCAGASVTLTSNSASGNQWLLNGVAIGGAVNQQYIATTSGDYTVAVTSNGCTSAPSTKVTVTVNPVPPTPTISAAGPTTFCATGSVTLNSSSATGNQWYLNGFAIPGGTGASYVATSGGNYTVTVTANGCSSTSTGLTLTTTPAPASPAIFVAGAGSHVICDGGSVTLQSNSSTGMQWYRDGVLIPSATGQNYDATQAGTYTATVTTSGCTSASSIGITLTTSTTPPTPSVTSPSTSFCFGGNVTLTSSSATGNQWYRNGSGVPGATGQQYVATLPGDYSVAVTNVCGTSPQSVPLTVTQLPIPGAPAITANGPTTICGSGSVTLSSSAASGNQWYKDGATIVGATSQDYLVTATGDYTVVSTQGGCPSPAAAVKHVSISPTPATPTASANGSTTICAGTSVRLTSSAASGNQWFLNGGALSSATGTTYDATQAGTYTVQVTANGCPSAMSNDIVVTTTPLPSPPVISQGGATTFCTGGSVTLSSSSASGNQWYHDGVAINGATGVTYNASTTGTYTAIITLNGCSSTSNSIPVVVNPYPAQPTISPAGTATHCSADGGVQLTSSASTGNQWLFNGAAIPGANSQTYFASVAGNYSVVSAVNGCTSNASAVTAVVDAPSPAAPTINAGGSTNLCPGGSVTLTSNKTSGNQWLRNGSPIAGATGQTYIASTTGIYSVQAVSGACSSTSLGVNVTVYTTPPTPTITTPGPLNYCGTVSPLTLTSSSSSGNQWFRDGNIIDGATGQTYQATTYGSFTVQTTVNGCPSSISAPTVITSQAIYGKPTITGQTSACATLPLTSSAGSSNQWYLNGTAIPGATSQNYTATVSGDYTVTVGTGVCAQTSDVKTITVLPAPPKPTINASGPLTICGSGSVTLTSSPAAHYSWRRNGSYLGVITPTYVATQSGSYDVVISDAQQCASSPSDPVNIAIDTPPTVTVTTASQLTTGTAGGASLAPVAGATYQWTITNGTINGSATGTSVNFTAGAPGTLALKATITTAGGCIASKTTNVLVTPVPGQEKFDPNGDVTVDPADVFYLVNFLFANGPAPKGTAGPVASGDANGDGVVDPADIFYTVNYLFTSGPHPFGHLAGTSTTAAAAPPLRATLSLGEPKLRDGKYVVPVIVTPGSGSVQALAIRLRVNGRVEGATIHRVPSLSPKFETTRDLSYVAVFDGGTRLAGVVAEVEVEVGRGRVVLTLDPAVTMLGNANGTLKASAGNGGLALRGRTLEPPVKTGG